MLDFVRLDTGDTLVGAAIFKPNHTLWPMSAGNAIKLAFAGERETIGYRYVEPVHVLTYPANEDYAHTDGVMIQ